MTSDTHIFELIMHVVLFSVNGFWLVKVQKMLDEIMQRLQSLSLPQQKEVLDLVKSLQDLDKREYERKEMETDIDIAIDDQVVQTTTLNLIGSGVYAYTGGVLSRAKK